MQNIQICKNNTLCITFVFRTAFLYISVHFGHYLSMFVFFLYISNTKNKNMFESIIHTQKNKKYIKIRLKIQ